MVRVVIKSRHNQGEGASDREGLVRSTGVGEKYNSPLCSDSSLSHYLSDLTLCSDSSISHYLSDLQTRSPMV